MQINEGFRAAFQYDCSDDYSKVGTDFGKNI